MVQQWRIHLPMQETWLWSLGGKIPWRRKCNPFQYSCLGNPQDRGSWWATVHGVAKSWHDLESTTTTARNLHCIFTGQPCSRWFPMPLGHFLLFVFPRHAPGIMKQRQAIRAVPCVNFWPVEFVSRIQLLPIYTSKLQVDCYAAMC